MKKPKLLLILDVLLFAGFLLEFFLDLTGLAVHQWLGVAAGAFALYHLWLHRDWVKAVTSRFFGRTSGQARLYYLVDAGIALGLFLIIATGLVISDWLSLPLNNYIDWRNLHVVASIGTLTAVVIKIAIHARWIVNTANKYIFAPSAPVKVGVQATAAAGRRQFLKLMGVVSGAAIVAGISSVQGLSQAVSSTEAAVQTSASVVQSSSSSSNPSASSSSSSTTSNSCRVRCNKHCPFPGRCRKYTDTNKNGYCDLGECV